MSQSPYKEVEVTGDKATIKGKLEVVSTYEKAVFIDLGFAGFGLNSVLLDGSAAPLGYDPKGQLGLIVKGKSTFSLEISGATRLKELVVTKHNISLLKVQSRRHFTAFNLFFNRNGAGAD